MGHRLGRALAPGDTPRAVLLGFPTDVGVRRNGGRAGAAGAPAAIRRAFYRLTPDARDRRAHARFVALLERTRDLGDLVTGDDLEADQERLGAVVAEHLAAGSFVVVLGGGHETLFGHFLGYARLGRRVSLLNFDAHADVRPLQDGRGHSGSPFRQALEHPSGCARRYRVAGLLPQSVARAHVDYVEAHGAALFREQLTRAALGRLFVRERAAPSLLVSFDIDAVDQAHAPGVSAPATGGLDPATWLDAAYRTGKAAHVQSCDVVEVNPTTDRDDQTARLAALTVWHVLRGLAAR